MDYKARARNIELIVLDVDGVLTGGQLIIGPAGEAMKFFHAHDGMGISLAQQAGLYTAIVTARESQIVAWRGTELKIRDICQGEGDKARAVRNLMVKYDLKPEQVAYVGDDLNDLPAFNQVGLACAVGNAAPEVKDRAHYVAGKDGGQGAVREIMEMILKSQGKWEDLVQSYLAAASLNVVQ